MATILDTGLLQYVSPIIVFILVYAVFYALLTRITLFGENKGVKALISLAIALLFIFIPGLRELVQITTPWFAILILAAMAVLVMVMFLGIKEESIVDYLQSDTSILTAIVILVLVVFLIAIAKVFGPIGEGTTFGGIKTWIVHPRFLGAIFILIVAGFVVRSVGYKR